MALGTELGHFEENRPRYLKKHAGKYAVIKGRECFGFFDSAEAAYENGVELVGAEPFLIKQVLSSEVLDQIPALTYGLLGASVRD